MSIEKDIKANWKLVQIKDVCEINPKFNRNDNNVHLDVSFIPMKAVGELSGSLNLSEKRNIEKVKKGYTYFENGDLLFAKITPCMENGKVAIADNLINGIGFGSTEFHVLRCRDILNNKFLFYFLIQNSFRNIAKRNMTGTAGQLRVPKKFIENTEIPLPPLPTQHRIVEKIEELFSELESGVKSLKKAKEQIGLYKQSVLKAAFAGELVKRETDEVKREKTNVKRDRAEGRGQQAEVLKAAEPGGEYNSLNHDLEGSRITSIKSNESTDKKSRQSHNQDNQGLDILPEGWKWVSVGDVGEIITGTTPSKKKKEYYGNEYPLYKPTDLNAGINTRDASDHLSKIGIKKARLLPENSILVTCIGATIGKTGMNKISGATNQQINAIVPNEYYVPEFIYYYSISDYFQQQIKNKASSTTLPILNKSKFERLLVPNVSLNQQHQIVAEIERRFSEAEHLEKSIDEGLEKAEALRQSILKQAFEGRLVGE